MGRKESSSSGKISNCAYPAIKDIDKYIKATQIATKQKNSFKASEVEVVNMVEDQDEKKYASQQFGCNG